MFGRILFWVLFLLFLFPTHSYADGTAVPDFSTVSECQTWVGDYNEKVPTETPHVLDYKSWLYSFAFVRSVSQIECHNDKCTKWFWGAESGPKTGGCTMIGYSDHTFYEDAWDLARRNLIDMINIIESEKAPLPDYNYGKECHYLKGSDPTMGDCGVMMYDDGQPCATLNPLDLRLHIPCVKEDGVIYWKEADHLGDWTFEMSNEGPGFDALGTANDCATYAYEDSIRILNIPCVILGDKSYWAKFEVLNTSPVQLRLKDHGENTG